MKPQTIILIALVVVALPTAPTHGQQQDSPTFVAPAKTWGGKLVSEGVPFQPSILYSDRNESATLQTAEQGKQPAETMFGDPTLRVASLAADTVPDATLLAEPSEPQLPPGARDGIFQKLFFTGTWLPQMEDDSLGWGDFESGLVFGFPLLRRDTPLLVTPRFGLHTLDGPTTPDLPARVYDTSFEFRHLRKFGESPWAMDAAVTLGYYSDFERSSSDAFRVTGYGLGVYESSPTTKWVFGVAYLNRAGATVLPIGGVIIERSPDVRWELVVPRPRVAWRLPGSTAESGDERWFYIAGEFGGGVWSIERPITQTLDLLTYRDYRVMIGYERKIIGGLTRRFEVGYVFGRELEFDSPTPNVTLDDTLLARAGFTY